MSTTSYDCLGENVKTPFGDYLPPDQKRPLTFYVKQGNSSHFDQVVVGSATANDMPWLWSGHIPMNRVTLFEGPAGAGKSFVVLDLVARFTSDRPWPDGAPQANPGGKALILNRQDHSADVVGARLKSLGAPPDRFTHFLEFNTADEKSWHRTHRSASLPLDIPAIEKMLESDESIRLVVIDPVSDFCSTKKQLAEAIHALNRLAANRKVAIVVTLRANAKFNRDGELVVKNKFDTDAARCQWCCVPDPEEPGRNLFMPTLMNYSAVPMGRAYRLGNLHITWDEETVDPRRPLKSEDECDRWLRDLLGEGDLPGTEVIRLGNAMGFSTSKINRTRNKIGVKFHWERVRGKPKSLWSMGQSRSPDPDDTDSDDTEQDEEELTDEQMIDQGYAEMVYGENLVNLPEGSQGELGRIFKARMQRKSPEELAEFVKFLKAKTPKQHGLPPELQAALDNPIGAVIADMDEEEVEGGGEVEGVEEVEEVEKGQPAASKKSKSEKGSKSGGKLGSAGKRGSQGKPAKPEPYKSLTGKPLDPEMAEEIARLLALFDQDEPPRKERKPSEDDFVPGAFPATDAEIEQIVKGKRQD